MNDFDPLKEPTPAGQPVPKIIPRPRTDFWVFAYGSLIWNPGFEVVESKPVLVQGYHRRFCVRSTFYRGTENHPGLVVGLREGGTVTGLIHRVAAAKADETLSYLEDREFRHDGYRHVEVDAQAVDGTTYQALTFVVPDESHSYVPLSDEEIAYRLATARGANGPNDAYLFNLNEGLRAANLDLGNLESLERDVRALQSVY